MRDPPEPQQSEQQEQRPGHQRDRRHHLGGAGAGDPREQHRAARDRRQRGTRPRRDVPRGAKERVDDCAGRGRVQAVLHRHARDARIPQVFRHDHRRHREPREHVAAEHGPVIAREPVHDRNQPTHAATPSLSGALHDGPILAESRAGRASLASGGPCWRLRFASSSQPLGPRGSVRVRAATVCPRSVRATGAGSTACCNLPGR